MGWLTSALEWIKGLPPTLALSAITFIPALELRASIPYGILVCKLPWPYVAAICVLANIILGVLCYIFLDKFVHFFLRWPLFARAHRYYVCRAQSKVRKSVDRFGELGIAVFIGVPLPGTGVYTGALAAYALGLSYRKFVVADILGVLMAAAIVTLACLFPRAGWWVYKMI